MKVSATVQGVELFITKGLSENLWVKNNKAKLNITMNSVDD